MEQGTRSAPLDGIVVRRMELVDDYGHVRASAGHLGQGVYGLAFHDEEGHERLTATTGAHGVSLAFVSSGNEVLVVGCAEPDAGDDRTAFVFVEVADANAEPLVRLRVGMDGAVEFGGRS